jgi:hypothetical protein
MNPKLLISAIALLLCNAVLAAPAPWYLWKSKVDGTTFCSQTSPGEAWVRFKGPFDNGRCVKREPGDGDGLIRKMR